jgi:3-oxoadipate enol-lactonase
MPTLQSNGITLEYDVEGAGPPLVLISGLGYGRWCWRSLVPLLSRSFRVVTFDNRGAGGSEKAPGPYSTPMMAADTLGLMGALGIERAHVVGHSLGSLIAQRMALSAPDRIGGLVLVSSTFGGPKCVPIPPAALKSMTDRSGEPEAVIERGLRIAFPPGYAERNPAIFQEVTAYRMTFPVPGAQYTAQVMAGAGHDTEALLHQVRSPTLIVTGDQDLVVPAGNAELLRARIPKAMVEVLPGIGHMVPVEVPEQLAAMLKRFLGEVPL